MAKILTRSVQFILMLTEYGLMYNNTITMGNSFCNSSFSDFLSLPLKDYTVSFKLKINSNVNLKQGCFFSGETELTSCSGNLL